ncbi:Increased DNA methylation 1 [Bienertia sinuspersici]
MKRELAALETKSPVLDSTERKTRASLRSSGGALGGSLVYKRVKKSQVKKAELLSNGVNGVDDDVSMMSEAVSQQNGVQDGRNESGNGLLKVEERETGVAAELSGELVKEVCDEGDMKLEEPVSVEEKDVNGGSLAVKDALPRNVVVMGVATVDGLMKNVKSDDIEVNNGSVKGKGSTKCGNAEEDNELHVNNGSIKVDKDKVVEGVSKKSPLKAVNGNANSSSVERHSRRFTRSTLKSKVDTMTVENETVEENAESMKAVVNKPVTNEPNGEASNELAIVVYQSPESKEELKGKNTRRLTRSASKSKVEGSSVGSAENVTLDSEKAVHVVSNENAEYDMDKHNEEPTSATPRRKLEMKMSKQISPTKIPTTVLELFGTGMLEGCPVYYDGGKGRELHGRIRGIGILCSCSLCKGMKVIPPSLFEIHACNTYKRAVQYIYLDNGRSLIHILKTCKSTRLNTLEATIHNAIGPLPEKKVLICQNCSESFSTMDAESSEPVCSTCVMSNMSPVGPVYSSRKRCRSSKFIIPCQAASASDVVQDASEQKPVEKSPKVFCTPKSKSSQGNLPSDLLQGRRRSKSVEKSADAFVTPTLRRSSRFERISETTTPEEIVKKSEEASMLPKTCTSPVLGSSEAKRRKKQKERLKKEILTPKPSKIPSTLRSSEKKSNGKITRKDLRLHKLVFEDDVLPEGTELGYYARGKKLLDGYKKGAGIYCNCCDTVVSASQFEAHAGCASRRKPYCYIYTSNGVSLHELSVTLIKDRRHSAKYNDDLCSICADGGSLLLCDGCPRAFHKECASLPSIPVGKWYCKYCENMFEREKFVAHNANAVAAGRISGVDSIEQITKRSIRIVNNPASEVSACILCRGYDFCKSGFGPRTIILCDQLVMVDGEVLVGEVAYGDGGGGDELTVVMMAELWKVENNVGVVNDDDDDVRRATVKMSFGEFES